MKKISIISALSLLIMCFLSLIGCGNKTTATTNQATTKAQGTTIGQTTTKEQTNAVTTTEKTGYSISELSEALSSSEYTNAELEGVEGYGLSNASNVGVIESEVKELYAMKADGEFKASNIIEVTSITLSDIQKYYPSVSEISNLYKVRCAIEMAREANQNGEIAKIKFPSGNLTIEAYLSDGDRCFNISGLDGTYFEGNGTVLDVTTSGTAWKGFMTITDSKNVQFNDISFNMVTPSSLVGVVTAGNVTNKTITIKIDNEFKPLVERLLVEHKKMRSWDEYNYQTKNPLQDGNFLVDTIEDYTIEEKDGEYYLTATFKTGITRPRNGSFVSCQFSQYDVSGIYIASCENVTLENIDVNSASGMGLVASSTTNLYVNRFNLVPSGNSLISATADAMHFVLMHGEVKVTNSIVDGSHDDALNIKYGYWYKLVAAEGGTTKTIQVAKLTGAVDVPEVGDKISVYDELSFEGHNPTQGYYTIASVEATANGYKFTVNERMANVSNWGDCRVTFISDTPEFTFKNNIVRNKRNRGILVQVPGALIENNTFDHVGHGSIQAATAMDIYNEATLAQNTIIRNNKFIGNCYLKPEPLYGDVSIFAISNNATVAPAGTIKGVLIENNFFTSNGNAAVSFRGVGESKINSNLFYDCSKSQPSGDSFNCLFQFVNCASISLDSNYNYYTLDQGLDGVVCQGLTMEADIDIKTTNKYIEYQRSEEAGAEVKVSKATGSITVDGDISEWESIGATTVVIDGVSTAEGVAKTLDDIKDHFAINKLYITYTADGIYIAFDVYDNEIAVKTVNDFWLGDCVELFISDVVTLPNADMQVYKEQGSVIQAALAPTWSKNGYFTFADVRTNSSIMSNKSKFKAAMTLTSSGYTGEFYIPFDATPTLKATVDAKAPVDIAIIIADCERQDMGLKRIQAGNVPHFVEEYKTKTARMPRYIFD